jgi:hypothetical protein
MCILGRRNDQVKEQSTSVGEFSGGYAPNPETRHTPEVQDLHRVCADRALRSVSVESCFLMCSWWSRGNPPFTLSKEDNSEIMELLRYIGHNPQTHCQQGNDVWSTDTISCPRYSNSTHQQYIRISKEAWNIFLKCYLCLRPKTDNPITIDFHDTWDTLVKQNNNALRNRPGIGYLTNPKRPTGLEWNCITL